MHRLAARWLAADDLVRDDGFIYAVDVAQLAIYAAQRRDRPMFAALRRLIVDKLVLNDPAQPYTQGFVAWRCKPGEQPHASGTTEALRAAEALWLGAEAFDRPEDRDQAVLILRGYARHAYVDQGVWFIRNYFNFRSGAFATNSYLVDYDPDFLFLVGAAIVDDELRDVAQRSAELIEQAVAPSGLLHQVVQPELLTIMPAGQRPIFSPNNVEQLSNTATVAQRCAQSCRAVAERVLRFTVRRVRRLHLFYDATTGKPIGNEKAAAATYAAGVRLAIRLGDRPAHDELVPTLTTRAVRFAESPGEPRLYIAGELLLALQQSIDFQRLGGSP